MAHAKYVPPRARKPWTKRDLSIITEDWGSKSIPQIAKNLERSINAVRHKACEMNLGAVLVSGDYITLSQLVKAVTGQKRSDSYKLKSWVENRGLPVHTRKVEKRSFRVVYLKEFWQWAEKNRDFLDFSKMEPYILGEEPSWVEAQRKKDFYSKKSQRKRPWTEGEIARLKQLLKQHRHSYSSLSKELDRSCTAIQRKITKLGLKERPLPMDNQIKWTEAEVSILKLGITEGESLGRIAEKVSKSELGVRDKMRHMYGTGNLDHVRGYLENEEPLPLLSTKY